MSNVVDMTVGSPTKHIIKFSIPLLLANLGQQLYMIVDASIVGRGVGVDALASVGTTDWTYWMILWAIVGLTQGFSTFISRYFGDKNYDKLNKVIAMSSIICIVVGAILTILGIVFARPLLNLLNTPDNIIDGATTYLITMVAGTIIITAYNMASSILRALGDGKTPFIAMLVAGVLNILLDLLFVLVFKLGIFGAAIASVISQLISFIYCLLAIRKIEIIKLDRNAFKIDFKMIKNLMVFSLPISLEYIVISIGGIVLQSSVNLQGSSFIAGYTATNKVYGLLECRATTLGIASSTFLAQNYGAKLYDRVKQGVKSASIITIIMAIFVFALMMISRKYVLQLFIDLNEVGAKEALAVGVRYLTIMLLSILILYFIHIFRNTLQAIKVSFWSMISGVMECVCRIFMAKVAINWAFLGSDALFVSEPVAWLGALLCVLPPYFYYRKKLLKTK
jgi:putative MATE family efflux protein